MRKLFQSSATQCHQKGKALIVTAPQVIIYGAEAAPRPPLSIREQLRAATRRKVHGYLDAARFHHGDLSRLDYRNYEGRDAINLGDVAIAQSTTALVRQWLPAAEIRRINWGELSQYSVKKEDRQKTALVFSGSGYFFLAQNGRLPARIKDDIAWLLNQQIPAFFFGAGLNRPGQTDLGAPVSLHPEDAALITQLLDYAQAISVRDAGTQSALAPLTSKPVHLTGDPALHFSHAMQIEPPSTGIHPANTPPVIGVNFSFHGKNSTALLKKNLQAYCDALLKLQHENGAEFRYFVHYGTENVLPKLLAQRGIKIKKIGAGDTATLAHNYAKLDLHIGGMLHSCILATSAGTPCLALAYDIKHQGFFDLMGLSENCLSAADFDPETLYLRAMDLLANPAPVRSQLVSRRNQLEIETHAFLQTCFAE